MNAFDLSGNVGPLGIICNAVAPDFVVADDKAAEDQVCDAAWIPLRRRAMGAELGATTVYLASSAPACLTGRTLVLNWDDGCGAGITRILPTRPCQGNFRGGPSGSSIHAQE